MPTEAGHRLLVEQSTSSKFLPHGANEHEERADLHSCDIGPEHDEREKLGEQWLTDDPHNTHPERSLVKIEGVDDTQAANFYLGKRVAFVYKAQKEVRGTKTRVIWGRVMRSHGNSGVVQARFTTPLPTKSFGASLRVMLFPSAI
ncbi:60S ribosomal protein L33-A [Seiridium cupressi]